MSLFKQMMIFVTALLFIILVIVFVIHFKVTQRFVEKDLYQRAKNSVNSLSLSLGDVSEDRFMMETTINAMFDGGRFRRIVLRDTDNKVLYETQADPAAVGVPQAFLRLLNLQAPVAEAVVSSGWRLVGSLQVQAHSGDAVIRMWEVFKHLCFSFCIIWGGALVVSGMMLKLMLRSLSLIRAQAQAIEENRFIINSHMPFTVEFRTVTVQMNKMVATVQNNYDRSLAAIKEAKKLRFQDRMTGLHNKAYFINRIEAYMNSHEPVSSGEAMLVAVDGLSVLKEAAGWQTTERFIRGAADSLVTAVNPIDGQVTARLNHREFALILPGTDEHAAVKIAEAILDRIREQIDSDPDWAAHLRISAGLAAYGYEEGASTIFSKLDYAVTQARNTLSAGPFHFHEAGGRLLGRQEWKGLIRRALDRQEFIFLSQPVYDRSGDTLHNEVFIAIGDDETSMTRAGIFMPTATELNMAQEIDRHVIHRVVEMLEDRPASPGRFSINISADFIGRRSTMVWVTKFLSDHGHLSDRLYFEISEASLTRYPEVCLDFAGLLGSMGFRLGIDNFTLRDDSLAMLRQVIPAYIKSDADCLYDAQDPSRSRITLEMLQTIAQSIDARLIATKIETSNQIEELTASGIRYFQGNHVGGIHTLDHDLG